MERTEWLILGLLSFRKSLILAWGMIFMNNPIGIYTLSAFCGIEVLEIVSY